MVVADFSLRFYLTQAKVYPVRFLNGACGYQKRQMFMGKVLAYNHGLRQKKSNS
ncbi:MAG: hypothetical protein ACD_69C00258G0002 [uncultured bacterium]|nr:MAG: hypothetical protein ACD_69C00258G0002 [uncultured bacterium]